MSYWFSFFFPWLLLLWLLSTIGPWLKIPARGWRRLLLYALVSGALVFLPLSGLPLGRWLAGLNVQPGIPLLGLFGNLIWKRFFQRDLLRPGDRKTAWYFGALLGTVLYPMALGLGNFDPYSLGWSFSSLFLLAALGTLWLIWKDNRFGLLLLLSIVAYDARCLESINFWDYLLDPVYWVLSLGVLGRMAVKRIHQPKAA